MFLYSTIFLSSCKKIIDLNPVTEIDNTIVGSEDAAAIAATLGQYDIRMNNVSFPNGQGTRFFGQYADEIRSVKNNATDNAFASNQLQSNNITIQEIWNANFKKYIYPANSILEILSTTTKVTTQTRDQLKGETFFLRAMAYFDLVNLFGDIPLVLHTNPDLTAGLGRAPQSQVFAQIIADLKAAQSLLPVEYPKKYEPPADRVRANKWAATALLAKVYLFNREYTNAAMECSKVLEMGSYEMEKDLDNVFLAKSRETIFALLPTNLKYNTVEGKLFGGTAVPPAYVITDDLAAAFDSKDARAKKWIRTIATSNGTYKVPAKYKVYESEQVIEYNIILRLPEMYLIRAEANAALGKMAEAIADLNVIRKRAGIDPLPHNLDNRQLMDAIELEDRRENFAEQAHRWFNMRRWKSTNPSTPHLTRADDVLSAAKPDTWQPFRIYCPIPRDEILKSVNLTQNAGY